MTIAELIEKLMELPLDMQVNLYHQSYNGGGDDSRFDEPTIVNLDDKTVTITSDIYTDTSKWVWNH